MGKMGKGGLLAVFTIIIIGLVSSGVGSKVSKKPQLADLGQESSFGQSQKTRPRRPLDLASQPRLFLETVLFLAKKKKGSTLHHPLTPTSILWAGNKPYLL